MVDPPVQRLRGRHLPFRTPGKALMIPASDPRRVMSRVTVVLVAFEPPYEQGHMLLGLSCAEPRRQLEALQLAAPAWRTPPYVEGDCGTLRQASKERVLEGIVAKRLDSKYE